ncbi:carbohydrate-binding module family 18 protein [Lophiostoma macrostomum CBS 122681]|uniref:Carbohydrate-binding module family 18 protein n=1 Tax=Lophiostoma macrostomum CBS 122681 TaxID=1314788 RepID=A0A6A6SSS8_9PLEO|nr:carbohydrate-binding module family 18 protein [Lophiostoma macrostomum CBS 122681]
MRWGAGVHLKDIMSQNPEVLVPLQKVGATKKTSEGLRSLQAGRCGADFSGARCPDNQCCSQYGYCGNEFEFCGDIVGCQPAYGRCGDTPVTSSSAVVPSSTPTPTPTPTPSSSSTPVIPSSSSVATTSSSSVATTSSSSIATTSASSVSPPIPSVFGSCCSQFYFCGSGAAYCGTGCNPAFGTCGGAPPVSSSSVPIPSSSAPPTSTPPPPSSTPPPPPPSSTPTPSPSSSIPVSSSLTSSTPAQPTSTLPVSQDGTCGNGVTCTGSTFGRCCSDYFYCGNQDDYCRPAYGCRPEFGTCGSAAALEFLAM